MLSLRIAAPTCAVAVLCFCGCRAVDPSPAKSPPEPAREAAADPAPRWMRADPAAGTLDALELEADGAFRWIHWDQRRAVRDLYKGSWLPENGAVVLTVREAQTHAGAPIHPAARTVRLNLVRTGDQVFLEGDGGFRFIRASPGP